MLQFSLAFWFSLSKSTLFKRIVIIDGNLSYLFLNTKLSRKNFTKFLIQLFSWIRKLKILNFKTSVLFRILFQQKCTLLSTTKRFSWLLLEVSITLKWCEKTEWEFQRVRKTCVSGRVDYARLSSNKKGPLSLLLLFFCSVCPTIMLLLFLPVFSVCILYPCVYLLVVLLLLLCCWLVPLHKVFR